MWMGLTDKMESISNNTFIYIYDTNTHIDADIDIDKIISFLLNSKCDNILWEKNKQKNIFANDISDKKQISKMYEELKNNNKKSDKKWAEGLQSQVSNEYI